MTAPWDVEPCAWPDGPELDRQLAAVDRWIEPSRRIDLNRLTPAELDQVLRGLGPDPTPITDYGPPATNPWNRRRGNPMWWRPVANVLEGSL